MSGVILARQNQCHLDDSEKSLELLYAMMNGIFEREVKHTAAKLFCKCFNTLTICIIHVHVYMYFSTVSTPHKFLSVAKSKQGFQTEYLSK